jgi:hypothetical protein
MTKEHFPILVFDISPVIKAGMLSFSENIELKPKFDTGIISMKYMMKKKSCLIRSFFHFIRAVLIFFDHEKNPSLYEKYTIRVSAENSIKISTLISKNSIISKEILKGLSNNSKKLSILRFSRPELISMS